MSLTRRSVAAIAAIVTAGAGLLAGSGIASAAPAHDNSNAFIGPLSHTKVVSSTIPQNGDVNPYGVAVVPRSTGNLQQGDVLVSNFNNSANVQGTGTTIVQVSPHGGMSLFAGISDPGCPGGVGLTTALVVLRSGWVIVGSLPTQNNGATLSGPGCLIVLDQWGHVRNTITGHGIDGPWDMTALDLGNFAELFVTNVLGGILGPNTSANGGTVQRLVISSSPGQTPQVLASKQIGSDFPARTDSAALVIGPTGVGLGFDGTLYVADSLTNRIAAIPNAVFRNKDDGSGRTVSEGMALNDPLGLAITPNGHILTANGADGNLVETTPGGNQVAVKTVDNNLGGGGNLFGLAIKPGADAVYFVDDFGGGPNNVPPAQNNLQLFF
jgi:hypothetical protein